MEGLIEGRVVHYVINDQDAIEINRRRVPGVGHGENWPAGAQAHVGNHVMAGEHFPAMVVRVFPHEFGDEPGANLQVLLDGNDQFWATSIPFAEPEALRLGTWHWIEKV